MTPAVMGKKINRLFLRNILIYLGHEKEPTFTMAPEKMAELILEQTPGCSEEQRKFIEEQLAKARANPEEYAEVFAPKEKAKKAAPKSRVGEKATPDASAAPTTDLAFRIESLEKAIADVQERQARIELGVLHIVRSVTEHSEISSLGDLSAGE